MGVGHGQFAALGRRPGPDLTPSRGDPGLPASGRRVRRLRPAPDRRALRPLRVSRQALPGLELRPRADSSGVPVRRPRRALQLDPRPGQPRPRGDCPRSRYRCRTVRDVVAADRRRSRRLLESLRPCEVSVDGIGRVVASVPPDDPDFDPARYWRGPVWPMLNWVAHAGLRRYGFVDEAAEIRQALLELARREGFWEHYNARTGHGGGTEELSWTAALVLDLLDAEHDDEGGGA